MTRMIPQLHTCTLILGFTALVGFTLVGSHAGAVSPSDSSSASHFSDQHWDRKLPSASRFTILSAFGDAAVRDNETGLVWEKTLETAEVSWTDARAACADRDVGGRKAGGCRRFQNWRVWWIPRYAQGLRFPWIILLPTC